MCLVALRARKQVTLTLGNLFFCQRIELIILIALTLALCLTDGTDNTDGYADACCFFSNTNWTNLTNGRFARCLARIKRMKKNNIAPIILSNSSNSCVSIRYIRAISGRRTTARRKYKKRKKLNVYPFLWANNATIRLLNPMLKGIWCNITYFYLQDRALNAISISYFIQVVIYKLCSQITMQRYKENWKQEFFSLCQTVNFCFVALRARYPSPMEILRSTDCTITQMATLTLAVSFRTRIEPISLMVASLVVSLKGTSKN